MEEIKKKIIEAREMVEYGSSDLYSGLEGLPNYRANESSRDYLSNAESYIVDAMDMLDNIVEELIPSKQLDVYMETNKPVDDGALELKKLQGLL